jgi:hypothetical protein
MSKIWIPGGGGGVDLDVTTAQAGDILAGKVIVGPDGEPLTGTMPNRGAVSQVLPINGNYTIPAGYHNGLGKVTQNIPVQGGSTITPGTITKTAVAAGRYVSGNVNVAGDPNLIASNIRDGVTIFGVRGNVVEYKSPATVNITPKLGVTAGRIAPSVSIDPAEGGTLLFYTKSPGSYAFAMLNNGSGLNLTGWNYINASTYMFLGYNTSQSAEWYFGVSRNSNLSAFTFDAVDKTAFSRNDSKKRKSVKLNVTSLSGVYFLYIAVKVTGGSENINDRSQYSVKDITLSTQ